MGKLGLSRGARMKGMVTVVMVGLSASSAAHAQKVFSTLASPSKAAGASASGGAFQVIKNPGRAATSALKAGIAGDPSPQAEASGAPDASPSSDPQSARIDRELQQALMDLQFKGTYRLECTDQRDRASESKRGFSLGKRAKECRVSMQDCSLLKVQSALSFFDETEDRMDMLLNGFDLDVGQDNFNGLEKVIAQMSERRERSFAALLRYYRGSSRALFRRERFRSELRALVRYLNRMDYRHFPTPACNLHGLFDQDEIDHNHLGQSCGAAAWMDYEVKDRHSLRPKVDVYIDASGPYFGTRETSYQVGSMMLQNLACQRTRLLRELREGRFQLKHPACRAMAREYLKYGAEVKKFMANLEAKGLNQELSHFVAVDARDPDRCYLDEMAYIRPCSPPVSPKSSQETLMAELVEQGLKERGISRPSAQEERARPHPSQQLCYVDAINAHMGASGAITRLMSCELYARSDQTLHEVLISELGQRELYEATKNQLVEICKIEAGRSLVRFHDCYERRLASFYQGYFSEKLGSSESCNLEPEDILPAEFLKTKPQRTSRNQPEDSSGLALVGLMVGAIQGRTRRRRWGSTALEVAMAVTVVLSLSCANGVPVRLHIEPVCRGRNGFTIHDPDLKRLCCEPFEGHVDGALALKRPYPLICPQPPMHNAVHHMVKAAGLLVDGYGLLEQAKSLQSKGEKVALEGSPTSAASASPSSTPSAAPSADPSSPPEKSVKGGSEADRKKKELLQGF